MVEIVSKEYIPRYENFFILLLINRHPRVSGAFFYFTAWSAVIRFFWFFYLTASSAAIPKCGENSWEIFIRNFCFRKNMSFLSFRLESSISQTLKIFSEWVIFYFLSLECSYLKFFNVRTRKFHFLKYKEKLFFWENINSSISRNIFLTFFRLGLKSGLDSTTYNYRKKMTKKLTNWLIYNQPVFLLSTRKEYYARFKMTTVHHLRRNNFKCFQKIDLPSFN